MISVNGQQCAGRHKRSVAGESGSRFTSGSLPFSVTPAKAGVSCLMKHSAAMPGTAMPYPGLRLRDENMIDTAEVQRLLLLQPSSQVCTLCLHRRSGFRPEDRFAAKAAP